VRKIIQIIPLTL